MAQPPADVWGLGATAFHALSGRPPYEVGDNVMGALYRIVHEEPPRLEDAGWLTALLENTMAQDPADRWPMPQVRDFLAGGPLAAASATTMSRTATAVAGHAGDGDGVTQVLAPTPPTPAPPPVRPRRSWGPVIGVLSSLLVV